MMDVSRSSLMEEQHSSSTEFPQSSELSSSFSSSSQQPRQLHNPDTHQNISIDGDEEEGLAKIFLSVYVSGNKLGAAYYDSNTSVLYLMADIVETGDFNLLKQLIVQVNPDSIVASTKQKESFMQTLMESEHKDKVEVVASKNFTHSVCKQRIYGLNGVGDLTSESTDEERTVFFSSLLCQGNHNMVCAAGGLLKYLDQVLLQMDLEDVGTAQIPILLLKIFTLDDLLFIDDNTRSSLQIFQRERHPSVYKSFGEGKEGLSLFGIMNHTKSAQGSALLKEWFMRPSMDMEMLQQRQAAVAFFVEPANIESVSALKDALRNTKNIMGIISKMKSAGVRLLDWDNLYKTLFNAICLGDICQRLPRDIPIMQKVGRSFSKKILLHMANLIKQIINFDESAYANHFVVNAGVDNELDEMKRAFDGIPFLMTQVAQKELSRLNNTITKCSVTYLPQLGYLLNLPLTHDMKETHDYNIDDSLEFKFIAEDLVYYKSAGTLELDDKLGDIHFDIRDREMAIMHRLQNVILEHADVVYKIVQLSAELDSLLALASAARELNFTRPLLRDKDDDVIKIIGGRHILQELCVDQFVANDSNIGGESGKVHILTAPNASGKSVYLKQIAMITYLAHIGSFVPAECAEISIRDGLFTRIHAKESVSIPLSTFMIDLNQIAFATSNTTKHSLVIIDEFGKGTASADGLALLCATLKYWINKGDLCPTVILSTHFHAMTTMVPKSSLVAHYTMDVMQTEGELVFLYKLIQGSVEHSHAYLAAEAANIPAHILQRANQIGEKVKRGEAISKCTSAEDEAELHRIVGEFLKLDIESDDLRAFLNTLR